MLDALRSKFDHSCGVVYGVAASLEAEKRESQAMALYDAVNSIVALFDFLEREDAKDE